MTLARRRKAHFDEAKAGSMILFHRALRKYGTAVEFQTLVVGEKDYIIDLEPKAIVAFQTRDRRYGYNLAFGGQTSPMHVPEIAARNAAARKGRKCSQKELDRLSEIRLRVSADPKNKAAMSKRVLALWADPAFKTAQSERMRALWNDPAFRERMRLRDEAARIRCLDPNGTIQTGRKKYQATPECRINAREQMKMLHSDPIFVAANSERQSARLKALHASTNPEDRAKLPRHMRLSDKTTK